MFLITIRPRPPAPISPSTTFSLADCGGAGWAASARDAPAASAVAPSIDVPTKLRRVIFDMTGLLVGWGNANSRIPCHVT